MQCKFPSNFCPHLPPRGPVWKRGRQINTKITLETGIVVIAPKAHVIKCFTFFRSQHFLQSDSLDLPKSVALVSERANFAIDFLWPPPFNLSSSLFICNWLLSKSCDGNTSIARNPLKMHTNCNCSARKRQIRKLFQLSHGSVSGSLLVSVILTLFHSFYGSFFYPFLFELKCQVSSDFLVDNWISLSPPPTCTLQQL